MSHTGAQEKRREARDRRWKSVSGVPGTLSDIREVSGPSGESDTGNRTSAVRSTSESAGRTLTSVGDEILDAIEKNQLSVGEALPSTSSTAPNSCQNSDTDSDSDLDETARMHQRLFKLQKQQEELDQQLGKDPYTVASIAVPKSGRKLRVRRRSVESGRKSSTERASTAGSDVEKDGNQSSGNNSRRSSRGSPGGRIRKKSSGSKGILVSQPDGSLKRVPSSLFYIDYDAADEADDDDDYNDEDDDVSGGKGPLPFPPDMPSSRKISAVQYSNFVPERDEGPKRTLGPFLGTQSKAAFVASCYTDKMQEIDAIMKPFRMADEQYKEVTELMGQAMNRGLKKDTNHEATVKMYPTYVRALPTGSEFGRFLALDLGGTNFRVLLVDLKGQEAPDVTSKQFLVPNRIMRGTGKALFDHIAQCIADFLGELGLKSEKHALGFTFSFACAQVGLVSARLVRWSKGFCCSGVEGQDVVELLNDAIRRRGDMQIECFGILNDNVGVLMTAARTDPNCLIGLILGTGTNCCYMEDLNNVELWDEDVNEPRQVIINTEWGAFGDDGCLDSIRNRYDMMVDEESLNQGRHLYEKMISGMYMGEIVRFVLCDLVNKGLLFEGNSTEELNEPYRFYTKYISEIESDDPTGEFLRTKAILEELSISPITVDDCKLVRHICWQVSQRAAHLAGAGVAAVINRVERNDVTVAVDGSLYRFHPHFKDLMSNKISQLIRPWQQFKLVLAHDGSGQGAAIVAAVAKSLCEEKTDDIQCVAYNAQDSASGPITDDNACTNHSPSQNNSVNNENCNILSENRQPLVDNESVVEDCNSNLQVDKAKLNASSVASTNDQSTKQSVSVSVGNAVGKSDVSSAISDKCAFSSSLLDRNDFNCKIETVSSANY